MKKLLLVLLVVALVIVPFSGVLAESFVMSALKSIDWTEILVKFVLFIAAGISTLIAWVYKRYAQPFFKSKGLENAANLAVKAVEAAIGRGKGAEKLEHAIDKVIAQGYKMERTKVVDAVLAAWYDLNLEQILIGEKKPPDKAV